MKSLELSSLREPPSRTTLRLYCPSARTRVYTTTICTTTTRYLLTVDMYILPCDTYIYICARAREIYLSRIADCGTYQCLYIIRERALNHHRYVHTRFRRLSVQQRRRGVPAPPPALRRSFRGGLTRTPRTAVAAARARAREREKRESLGPWEWKVGGGGGRERRACDRQRTVRGEERKKSAAERK